MPKFCENCGKPLKENQDICLNCGVAVKKDNPNTTTNITNINTNPTTAPKSKVCAGLLALFFGTLGIHNFYLGYSGKGVAQLLITLLTCGFGAFVTGVWALIEAIMLFTGSIGVDANGVPLQ